MKIKIFKTLNDFDEFNFSINQIKEIYAGLKLVQGQEYADEVIRSKYKYILVPREITETSKPVAVIPEVVVSNISEFGELLLIPDLDIEGDAFLGVAAAIVGTTIVEGAVVGSTIAIVATYAVAAIINIAIAMALNMVMSLLSPTKEFSSDPASAQHNNSNLFNGAPLIREQGGSVPLAFGYGYAGGVLISSSLSTAEQ